LIKDFFVTADILIPENIDYKLWSVIACDQFTSQIKYWNEVEKQAENSVSALRLMFPEAYIGIKDARVEAKKANEYMQKYIDEGVFKTIKDSFIYIERTLPGGSVRKGLLGAIDLEYYDYGKNSNSPIHATEGTIEERLPLRVDVRMNAPLEMPHIIVFIDDSDFKIIEPIAKIKHSLTKLYDFDLMAGGGHIEGRQIYGEKADEIKKSIESLSDESEIKRKYKRDIKNPVIFAIGDGNHSLATAKVCWENIKAHLTEEQKIKHPARYSLVELVNIHDESVVFRPIHRVIFNTDPSSFIAEAEKFWRSKIKDEGKAHKINYITQKECKKIEIKGQSIGDLIALNDEFVQSYINSSGGKIDYIHGDEICAEMARGENCAGALLPDMKKNELFASVMSSGVFPKKSFSIGHAKDKRYYLECRKIK